jgi:tRNA wybutosine-synthesizing protein 2
MNENSEDHDVELIVPSNFVKQVKIALEAHHYLNHSRKIEPLRTDNGCRIIPTLFKNQIHAEIFLQELGLEVPIEKISIVVKTVQAGEKSVSKTTNPLKTVVREWLNSLPLAIDRGSLESLERDLPTGYSIYHPMLLLSANTFSSPSWTQLLTNLSVKDHKHLYSSIAQALSVTHVAINAPIPPSLPQDGDAPKEENILRSPTHLQALYGDFGHAPISLPTAADFQSALWVSARQNGIEQRWAPRHTMFSRGNIREKTRLLHSQSVHEAVALDGGCTVVDLYAGIGYFAFSYAKAGAQLVLGWEVNPWSVEGLRLGAKANSWDVKVFKEDDLTTVGATFQGKRPKVVVFEMDNNLAAPIVESMKCIPPVRHVNCGLLPSSRGSWGTALKLIDKALGGWLHIHENFREDHIPELAREVLHDLSVIYAGVTNLALGGMKPRLDHIERVKTYAPGVMHCVIDIHVPGWP